MLLKLLAHVSASRLTHYAWITNRFVWWKFIHCLYGYSYRPKIAFWPYLVMSWPLTQGLQIFRNADEFTTGTSGWAHGSEKYYKQLVYLPLVMAVPWNSYFQKEFNSPPVSLFDSKKTLHLAHLHVFTIFGHVMPLNLKFAFWIIFDLDFQIQSS